MADESVHDNLTKFRAQGDAFEQMTGPEAGLIPNGIIARFERDYQLSEENLPERRLLGVWLDPMGTQDKVKQMKTPPRESVFVAGIGKDGEIVVICPDKETPLTQGWHARCLIHACQALGEKLCNTVSGRICGDTDKPRGEGEKMTHGVMIFKRHPKDSLTLDQGGTRLTDEGYLYPEHYVNNTVAQGIMRLLQAQHLEIGYAEPNRTTAFKRHEVTTGIKHLIEEQANRTGD